MANWVILCFLNSHNTCWLKTKGKECISTYLNFQQRASESFPRDMGTRKYSSIFGCPEGVTALFRVPFHSPEHSFDHFWWIFEILIFGISDRKYREYWDSPMFRWRIYRSKMDFGWWDLFFLKVWLPKNRFVWWNLITIIISPQDTNFFSLLPY